MTDHPPVGINPGAFPRASTRLRAASPLQATDWCNTGRHAIHPPESLRTVHADVTSATNRSAGTPAARTAILILPVASRPR